MGRHNSKRRINFNNVQGKLVENYGIVDFQDQVEKLFEMQAIQNWFSVENKLGCLEITMDYPQCFNAEVYAIEAGFDFAGEEDKGIKLPTY